MMRFVREFILETIVFFAALFFSTHHFRSEGEKSIENISYSITEHLSTWTRLNSNYTFYFSFLSHFCPRGFPFCLRNPYKEKAHTYIIRPCMHVSFLFYPPLEPPPARCFWKYMYTHFYHHFTLYNLKYIIKTTLRFTTMQIFIAEISKTIYCQFRRIVL